MTLELENALVSLYHAVENYLSNTQPEEAEYSELLEAKEKVDGLID